MNKTKCLIELASVLMLTSHFALPVSGQGKTPPSEPAAVKLNVGDPIVDGSSLEPYTNLWKLTIVGKTGKFVTAGAWTDDLRWVTVGGRKLLQRTQLAAVAINGKVTKTINVFDSKTLAPVRSESRGTDGDYRIYEFDGTNIKRTIMDPSRGSAPVEDTVTVDVPVFDFYGGMYGLLLAHLPLKAGYTATLPAIDENTDLLSWVTFTVTGREKVSAGSGRQVDAWVVESNTALGPMKFWLVYEAPYILRLTYTGPNGNIWSYDII